MLTQTLITDFFKKIKMYGYNESTECWHCVNCGANMGKNNPRQLCMKWYCDQEI